VAPLTIASRIDQERSVWHILLWQNDAMIDLNTLIVANSSLEDASAATSFLPTPREVPGNILPLVHSHRNNRFLLPALGPAWHSQTKGENQ
jgi:hypothetical protein